MQFSLIVLVNIGHRWAHWSASRLPMCQDSRHQFPGWLWAPELNTSYIEHCLWWLPFLSFPSFFLSSFSPACFLFFSPINSGGVGTIASGVWQNLGENPYLCAHHLFVPSLLPLSTALSETQFSYEKVRDFGLLSFVLDEFRLQICRCTLIKLWQGVSGIISLSSSKRQYEGAWKHAL